MAVSKVVQPDRTIVLIPTNVLSVAQTVVGGAKAFPLGCRTLSLASKFVRVGGGTTTKVYVQTSLDRGVTWFDIMCHAFAITTATKISSVRLDIAVAAAYVPTDAALTDDTIKDGLVGDRFRVKYVVVGTYTGASSIHVSGVCS